MEDICSVYWAKSKEDVIIPTKRAEDAGFDIYANFTYISEIRDILIVQCIVCLNCVFIYF